MFVITDSSFVELVVWKLIETRGKSSASEGFGLDLGIDFSMWPSGLCTGFVILKDFRGAGFGLGLFP